MHRSQGRDHLEQIEELIEQGLVGEVIGLIKTGKEASVYCCRGGESLGGALVAAKVYRGRQYRFRNDAVYQEARAREMGLRGRALRAFDKKTAFGREVQEGTWRLREYETLSLLYEAGADVPKPLSAGEGVVLMEYFGDEEAAADQLSMLRLEGEAAERAFRRLFENVETFLACNRVHGDLSPHNVLYLRGELRVIDFPQAVDPRFNTRAEELLRRDVANLCRYFEGCGVDCDATSITDELWRRFELGEL